MRVESRVAGGDVNPYLAFAGLLAAGLAGIDGGYELGPPWTGSGYDARDEPHVPSIAARGARAVRGLGARARGARRRGGRSLPERRRRRARRLRRRRHRLGAEALLRAPVSRPRIGICAYRTHARWTHWDARGDRHPAGLRRRRRGAGGRADPAAADAGRRRGGRRRARRHRRADPDRRPRPRPGALRRRARGGHRRAHRGAPRARRLRARAARAPPRSAGCPCSASAAACS